MLCVNVVMTFLGETKGSPIETPKNPNGLIQSGSTFPAGASNQHRPVYSPTIKQVWMGFGERSQSVWLRQFASDLFNEVSS